MSASFESETRLLEKIDKVSLLSHCSLFSRLNRSEKKAITRLMRLVEFKKGEKVFNEGETADRFYVVVSGRFEAFCSPGPTKRTLAFLKKGDYFGEMSLLTGHPHSATIEALSDSLLLELGKEDFQRIFERQASIALELSRHLSFRVKLNDLQPPALIRCDILSVVNIVPKKGRESFAQNLAASLNAETSEKIILLDLFCASHPCSEGKAIPLTRFRNIHNMSTASFDECIIPHGAGFDRLAVLDEEHGETETLLVPLLNQLAAIYRFILLNLPCSPKEPWFKALAHSDSIYFHTDSNLANVQEARREITRVEQETGFPERKVFITLSDSLFGIPLTHKVKKEFFGKRLTFTLPSIESDSESPNAIPECVERPNSEFARVLRRIARQASGNVVGLALGSGAALGLAHIGVLKVLERERIPVDIVAGSSAGALIGSLYAIGMSAEEIEKIALQLGTRWRLLQFLDFSLFPLRGLLHGREVVRRFKKYIGNRTFEDCRIPFRVAGANLSTYQGVIFDSGSILDAVRTSVAIPAIFEPTFQRNHVLTDGGVLDPLPIQALRDAGANKIIAVNVLPDSDNQIERRIIMAEREERERKAAAAKGPLGKGWHSSQRFLAKLFSPNVFDILMNTIQSMESVIAETQGESADILLHPVIPEANWMDFDKPRGFIRRGEEETSRALGKIRDLVFQGPHA